MIQTKKNKIKTYLDNKQATNNLTVFDLLLRDYISGQMKIMICKTGITKLKIYIDWHSEYKCINIQGRYNKNYVDIQIEPDEFSIGCDPIETDDHYYYKLESYNQLYNNIEQIINYTE